jgi:hypothetical protein
VCPAPHRCRAADPTPSTKRPKVHVSLDPTPVGTSTLIRCAYGSGGRPIGDGLRFLPRSGSCSSAWSPEYQPDFEDADTSLQAAVPIYGVYEFASRLGTNLLPFWCRRLERQIMKAFRDEEPEKFHRASLCLLRTSLTAQSLMFPRSRSSWSTPMLHLLYALLATARSSLKLQRQLALQSLASRQQLTIVLRMTSHRATHPSVEGWTRSDTRGVSVSCAHCAGLKRVRRSTRACRAVGNSREGPHSVRWVAFTIIAAHISRWTTF